MGISNFSNFLLRASVKALFCLIKVSIVALVRTFLGIFPFCISDIVTKTDSFSEYSFPL